MDGVAQAAEIAGQQLRCKRVGVDAQSIFDRLRKVDPAAWECKFMEAGEHQILAVPSGQPLSMFSPSRWSMCFFQLFFGYGAPNLEKIPNKKVSIQEIFSSLISREELLQYHLPVNMGPLLSQDFDDPEIVSVFADCVRRLRTLQEIRSSFARKGFDKDLP